MERENLSYKQKTLLWRFECREIDFWTFVARLGQSLWAYIANLCYWVKFREERIWYFVQQTSINLFLLFVGWQYLISSCLVFFHMDTLWVTFLKFNQICLRKFDVGDNEIRAGVWKSTKYDWWCRVRNKMFPKTVVVFTCWLHGHMFGLLVAVGNNILSGKIMIHMSSCTYCL